MIALCLHRAQSQRREGKEQRNREREDNVALRSYKGNFSSSRAMQMLGRSLSLDSFAQISEGFAAFQSSFCDNV